MANKELESGMAKLTERQKRLLDSWAYDMKYGLLDSEMSEAKGKILGFLNALALMGAIELREAIEVYSYYKEWRKA